jgi:hypothetical protein
MPRCTKSMRVPSPLELKVGRPYRLMRRCGIVCDLYSDIEFSAISAAVSA